MDIVFRESFFDRDSAVVQLLCVFSKKLRQYSTLGGPIAKSTVLSEMFFDEYAPDLHHSDFFSFFGIPFEPWLSSGTVFLGVPKESHGLNRIQKKAKKYRCGLGPVQIRQKKFRQYSTFRGRTPRSTVLSELFFANLHRT